MMEIGGESWIEWGRNCRHYDRDEKMSGSVIRSADGDVQVTAVRKW